jgi:glycerol-3-phosphate acyltransferase PlsY
MRIALLLVGAYLFGSIPFGVIVGRAWRGIDVRKFGSGNIGASNVLRVLGPGPAAAVFIGDLLKGYAPVAAGRMLLAKWGTPELDLWLLPLGLAPTVGHSFSVFLRFSGGRAVTTTCGVLFALAWPAAVIGLAIWGLVIAITRYISAASIVAAISVPIYMALSGRRWEWLVFWSAVALLVILRHIPNIKRLLAGTEAKIGERVEVDTKTGIPGA